MRKTASNDLRAAGILQYVAAVVALCVCCFSPGFAQARELGGTSKFKIKQVEKFQKKFPAREKRGYGPTLRDLKSLRFNVDTIPKEDQQHPRYKAALAYVEAFAKKFAAKDEAAFKKARGNLRDLEKVYSKEVQKLEWPLRRLADFVRGKPFDFGRNPNALSDLNAERSATTPLRALARRCKQGYNKLMAKRSMWVRHKDLQASAACANVKRIDAYIQAFTNSAIKIDLKKNEQELEEAMSQLEKTGSTTDSKMFRIGYYSEHKASLLKVYNTALSKGGTKITKAQFAGMDKIAKRFPSAVKKTLSKAKLPPRAGKDPTVAKIAKKSYRKTEFADRPAKMRSHRMTSKWVVTERFRRPVKREARITIVYKVGTEKFCRAYDYKLIQQYNRRGKLEKGIRFQRHPVLTLVRCK
jgi:DNA repair exonuclease SbcCD ATPase subunit